MQKLNQTFISVSLKNNLSTSQLHCPPTLWDTKSMECPFKEYFPAAFRS